MQNFTEIIEEELDAGGELLVSNAMLAYYYHGGRFGGVPYEDVALPGEQVTDTTTPSIIQPSEQSPTPQASRTGTPTTEQPRMSTFHLLKNATL